jgi:hypothetical protein
VSYQHDCSADQQRTLSRRAGAQRLAVARQSSSKVHTGKYAWMWEPSSLLSNFLYSELFGDATKNTEPWP